MKTKVILSQDAPHLGQAGDVVEVAAGYARNFLVPRGIAWPNNKGNVQRVEKARRAAEVRRLEQMKEFEALAERLKGVQLTFEEKVSDTGHLYGSVNAHRIVEGLNGQGIPVQERDVRLEEPLKEVGEYEVPVHVHAEIEASVKVWVVAAQKAED